MTRKGELGRYCPYYTSYKLCPRCKKIFHADNAKIIIVNRTIVPVCPYCSKANYEHLSLQEVKSINNQNPSKRKELKEETIYPD